MNRSGSHFHKGCRLAYEIQGSGPPVVLIQGVGVHGGAWAPQMSAFGAYYQCLRPLEQMAEDTLALMDAQGWGAAHLVGHSMGGLACLPTLVVSAEFDRIARPEVGRQMANVIPRARYIEIPGASHGVTILEAERINTLLQDHLRKSS